MIARKVLATFALLAAIGTAHAARIIEQPERPYELALTDLTLPAGVGGGVSFKRCESCSFTTHVLTAATRYFVNGQPVPFADFSRIAGEVRANRRAAETAFAGVYVDVETGRVTRLTMLHPPL